MANKIKLFSLQAHRYIEPISVNWAAKDDMYNLVDWRLTTKCIATSTAEQVYVFDRYPQDEANYQAGNGKASGSTEWDTGGIMIGNYAETDWSAASIALLSNDSPTDPGGTQHTTPIENNNGPFFAYKELNNDLSKRYIIVKIYNSPVPIKVSHFLFMKEHELTIRPQYSLDVTYDYDTASQKLSGNDEVVSLRSQNPIQILKRNFTILGGSTVSSVIEWFKEGAGNARFVVYLENVDTITDAYVCRLNNSQLKIEQKQHELYITGLILKTVPYYESGEDW